MTSQSILEMNDDSLVFIYQELEDLLNMRELLDGENYVYIQAYEELKRRGISV